MSSFRERWSKRRNRQYGGSLIEAVLLIALIAVIALPAVSSSGALTQCTLAKSKIQLTLRPVDDTQLCWYFDSMQWGLQTFCAGPETTAYFANLNCGNNDDRAFLTYWL